MTLLLVRHAVALRRRDWSRDDRLRPLSPRGYHQAHLLPARLDGYPIERILSSPSVRCVETVQPLAAVLGLPVETVPHLAEGAGTAALALLDEFDGIAGAAVLCSHGDVIPELLAAIAPKAVGDDGDVACAKGSTWVVHDPGAKTTYLPPPP